MAGLSLTAPRDGAGALARGLAQLAASRAAVPAILVLALALRVAVMIAFPLHPLNDSAWYLERGREIAQGMGYQEAGHPTAFWPVGYPALIGLACALLGPSLAGPLLFNLVAQLATLALILWFARRLGTGEPAARLAALLYALYPSHIMFTADTAAEVTSTAVAMAGAALLLHAKGRTRATIAAGVVLGLATLMRPQILLFPPVVVTLMLTALPDLGWRRALQAVALAYAGLALAVAPWTMRNIAVLHAPVLGSTNGGIALQAGANRLADGGYFQVERSPLWAEVGIPFAQHVERQVAIDARLKTMAKTYIADHPVHWFLLGFRKVFLLWGKDTEGFWAFDANYPRLGTLWKLGQAANQLFYLAVLGLGLAGFTRAARPMLHRRRPDPLLVAAAMPIFCSVLAFGFTGQTRYHFPAMPFVMIAAASVLARWAGRRAARAEN